MSAQQVKQEAKYYTRTPNMLFESYQHLHPQEKWLYINLAYLCGKEGTRHLSLRYISDRTGISIGALSGSKDPEKNNPGMIRNLHNAGLIHAEIKKKVGRNGKLQDQAQYHISIVDIWLLNLEFFTKCSDNEQSDDTGVQKMNESVQKMNTLSRERSENERERSDFDTNIRIQDKTTDTNKTTKQEEIVATSLQEDRNAPAANVHDIEAMRRRKTDPQLPAVTTDTAYHIATDGYEKDNEDEEDGDFDTDAYERAVIAAIGDWEDDVPTEKRAADVPTEKRAAVTKGASNEPDRHNHNSTELHRGNSGRDGDNLVSLSDQQPTSRQGLTSQQTPAASVSISLAVIPSGSQDDTRGRQAIRSPVSLSTLTPAAPAPVGASLTGNPPASPEARQGRQVIPKRPTPTPQPKSDTREIQRRIDEHRGYALEEKVDIVRERQAIKTWCNLHTLEEYGLVMSGAQKDRYWGKQENYYRIGGLTLLKITPEILARQRQPLQMVANGNGHQMEGLISQNGLVRWQGQWMTEEKANETGFNGGFGLYK